MKKIDVYGVCMWLGHLVLLLVICSAAFAGGGDFPPQQQVLAHVAEEENWIDNLEWILPGVITPIALFFLGYWFNKRRK